MPEGGMDGRHYDEKIDGPFDQYKAGRLVHRANFQPGGKNYEKQLKAKAAIYAARPKTKEQMLKIAEANGFLNQKEHGMSFYKGLGMDWDNARINNKHIAGDGLGYDVATSDVDPNSPTGRYSGQQLTADERAQLEDGFFGRLEGDLGLGTFGNWMRKGETGFEGYDERYGLHYNTDANGVRSYADDKGFGIDPVSGMYTGTNYLMPGQQFSASRWNGQRANRGTYGNNTNNPMPGGGGGAPNPYAQNPGGPEYHGYGDWGDGGYRTPNPNGGGGGFGGYGNPRPRYSGGGYPSTPNPYTSGGGTTAGSYAAPRPGGYGGSGDGARTSGGGFNTGAPTSGTTPTGNPYMTGGGYTTGGTGGNPYQSGGGYTGGPAATPRPFRPNRDNGARQPGYQASTGSPYAAQTPSTQARVRPGNVYGRPANPYTPRA